MVKTIDEAYERLRQFREGHFLICRPCGWTSQVKFKTRVEANARARQMAAALPNQHFYVAQVVIERYAACEQPAVVTMVDRCNWDRI